MGGRRTSGGKPLTCRAGNVVRPGQIVMNALGKPHGSIGASDVPGITSPVPIGC